jgi:hypothetical protein
MRKAPGRLTASGGYRQCSDTEEMPDHSGFLYNRLTDDHGSFVNELFVRRPDSHDMSVGGNHLNVLEGQQMGRQMAPTNGAED